MSCCIFCLYFFLSIFLLFLSFPPHFQLLSFHPCLHLSSTPLLPSPVHQSLIRPAFIDLLTAGNVLNLILFFRNVHLHEGLALPLVQQLEVWQLFRVPVGRDCILLLLKKQNSSDHKHTAFKGSLGVIYSWGERVCFYPWLYVWVLHFVCLHIFDFFPARAACLASARTDHFSILMFFHYIHSSLVVSQLLVVMSHCRGFWDVQTLVCADGHTHTHTYTVRTLLFYSPLSHTVL